MADQTAFQVDAFQPDPLAFQEIAAPPPPPPSTVTVIDTSLKESVGSLGGYLVGPPQFGDKTRPGAAYGNDVVLPIYDPNTMRPGPLPAPVNYMAEQLAEKRRKRNKKRVEAVALAMMMLMED